MPALVFQITCHLNKYKKYEMLQLHKKLRLVSTDGYNRECDSDGS